MYLTPTKFIAKLLATMQVLMTLDVPLSTTMALPVTSKPIESTVENMAWQAWIELPPEQKQQVKSRKVTPKSIFTLPLRVECPDGHKQVNNKCIPVVVGTNDVLIDLNALGLLVGNTPTEDLYDYDDVDVGMADPLPFGSEIAVGEAVASGDGLSVDLKPPSKDEPLKFNIFANKFHIFHEEPLEDYSTISSEGSDQKQNTTAHQAESSAQTNTTKTDDLVNNASNNTKNNCDLYGQKGKNYTASDSEAEESKGFSTLADGNDFKVDAISVPVAGFENDSSIKLVTTIIDTEAAITDDNQGQQPESDIQTLLQTESFLPLLNHTTATTLPNAVFDEKFSLTTLALRESNESSSDNLNLDVDEEVTTLPSAVYMRVKNKQEYTRSVTINPINFMDRDSVDVDADDYADNGLAKDSALEIPKDEPLEATTPIQLDETTIIETHSSLSAIATTQQELNELLLQEEHDQNDFEELQRMRKGQKDQHVVLKKSKVQPVEVLSTTTEATKKTTETATDSANYPAITKSVEEPAATTPEAETPLSTVHNENDNNDRFYYQNFAKHGNEVTLRSDSELKQKTTATTTAATITTTTTTILAESSAPVPVSVPASDETTTKSTNKTETIPLTSETDQPEEEEVRLINELVKGIHPATTTTLTTISTRQKSSSVTTMSTPITTTATATTTTTTTAKPSISTTKAIIANDESNLAPNSLSESLSVAKKTTPSAAQIWSKILPLLTTTTTTPMPKSSADESLNESNEKQSNDTQTDKSISSSSLRSNRNSKIIRINGFNTITAAGTKPSDFTAAAIEATTITEKSNPSSTTTTSSSIENSTYEPYWWLPAAWRLDKPKSSELEQEEQQEVKSEEQPLLLRFWAAYAPKSS